MVEVRYETEKNRSAAYDGDKLVGECDYEVGPDGWTVFHTETDPAYGGQGIARRRVMSVAGRAAEAGVRLGSTCSYATKVLG
jgi:predicted GNAT family acetyltransferase